MGWNDIGSFVKSSGYLQNLEQIQQTNRDFYKSIVDPARSRFIIVASPEGNVLKETTRLRHELESRGLHVAAIVFNKDYSHLDSELLQNTPFEGI
ncbi:MAG: hypothetical protein MJA31_00865, partial [Clostridia bacterium]|nr:hypothetical protein [Clostridia bacterium]